MSAPCGTPRTRGFTPRQPVQADPGMRVSDAERSEVADRLAKHYGDGRLDQAEFNERLDRALKAKTRADLDGLLDDLPEHGPGGGSVAGGAAPREAAVPPDGPVASRRRPFPRLLVLLAVAVVAVAVGHTLAWFAFPWLLILIVALIWTRGPAHRRRHRYRYRYRGRF